MGNICCMIIDDAPVIFLFYDETANFYSNRVNGMTGNAINQLNLDHITLSH